MQEPQDPLEGVLRSIAQRSWTRGPHENQLEVTLMREFDRAGRTTRLGSHRAVWIGGLVLLVGGAGFAASGGREAVRRLLVKVHLVGSETAAFEGAIDPIPGTSDYQTHIALDDGRLAELHVRVEDQLGVEGMKQVTVEIPEGDGAVLAEPGSTKTLLVSLGDDAANDERVVVDEIAEPERTLEWTDADGNVCTLYLVRGAAENPSGASFRLFRLQEDGTYLEVGRVVTTAGERTEVEDVDVDIDGLVNLALRSPNGDLMKVSLFVGSKQDSR